MMMMKPGDVIIPNRDYFVRRWAGATHFNLKEIFVCLTVEPFTVVDVRGKVVTFLYFPPDDFEILDL